MLTNEELAAIISNHRQDSLGGEDGQLAAERTEALDRYHGRLYGNEQEGRSEVVSKDLSEAVDWAMPAIMRIFTQSGTVAEFDPVSPEDEQFAEMETAYVNQVVMKDNDGWLVLHDAIKDALLLKNGYVKHWWDESIEITEEEYRGLVIQEVQQLLTQLQQDGAEVEVIGQDESVVSTPQGDVPVFDLKLKIKAKKGRVVIEAIPSEEIRVSRRCRGSLLTSPFTEHVTLKTRSDLIEMGMDKEFVNNLPTHNQYRVSDTQALSRDSVADESSFFGTSINDHAMDEVEYCEAYIRVDFDGDGIAELRRVVTVGNQVPDGEEWNRVIPEPSITSFTAKRVPHRHIGESLYDDIGDLQKIKTTLLRQMLDNVYSTNNNQWLVNERVNISDFMTSLPGGIKRIEGMEPVGGAVEAVMAQPIVGQILPVLDYVDGLKESRTGVSKAMTGLDVDTLQNTTKGAFLENMNRASQKIEMITRLIAETGVKELIMRVHSLLIRYQDKQRMIRFKGKFVPINPREWKNRTDVTVKVGLGTGNEEDRQNKLMLISQLHQTVLGPMGLVGANQAYALFTDLAKTMGFDAPDKYVMSPSSPEYQQKMQQPQPQDPQLQIASMKMQADQQKTQAELQAEQQKVQMQLQADLEKEIVKGEVKLQEVQASLELQASNDQRDAEREQLKAQFDYQLEQQRLEFERWKTEYVEQNKRDIEEMKIRGMPLEDAKAHQESMNQLFGGMQEMMMRMSAPKMIIRDETGRAIGVRSAE